MKTVLSLWRLHCKGGRSCISHGPCKSYLTEFFIFVCSGSRDAPPGPALQPQGQSKNRTIPSTSVMGPSGSQFPRSWAIRWPVPTLAFKNCLFFPYKNHWKTNLKEQPSPDWLRQGRIDLKVFMVQIWREIRLPSEGVTEWFASLSRRSLSRLMALASANTYGHACIHIDTSTGETTEQL